MTAVGPRELAVTAFAVLCVGAVAGGGIAVVVHKEPPPVAAECPDLGSGYAADDSGVTIVCDGVDLIRCTPVHGGYLRCPDPRGDAP